MELFSLMYKLCFSLSMDSIFFCMNSHALYLKQLTSFMVLLYVPVHVRPTRSEIENIRKINLNTLPFLLLYAKKSVTKSV